MTDIYIDGACSGNPGRGGWGVYVCNIDSEFMSKFYDIWQERYFSVCNKMAFVKMRGGADGLTTNNRMELQAAIESCKFINEFGLKNIRIFTDSTYVYKGITLWMKSWQRTDRLNINSRNPVKNIDLWLELDSLNKVDYKWFWVKGHSGNIGNDIADQLATGIS
ncbi:MAG: ribonuclease H [Pseudomonadota bacterium]